MLTRKYHKKSRNGCLTCKARRIKCDELKPNCANCDRKGLECKYVVDRDIKSSGVFKITLRERPYEVDLSQPITINCKALDKCDSQDDSVYMSPHYENYYKTCFSDTFELSSFVFNDLFDMLYVGPGIRDKWEDQFRVITYKHQKLFELLLGLAALYKFFNGPSKRREIYNALCSIHYSAFLDGFQSNFTPNNSEEALTALCTTELLILFLASTVNYKTTDSTLYRIGKGLEILYTHVQDFIPAVYKAIQVHCITRDITRLKGVKAPPFLAELLHTMPFEHLTEADSIQDSEAFDFTQSTPVEGNELKNLNIYMDTFIVLHNIYNIVYREENPIDSVRVIMTSWVPNLSREFGSLVEQKDPRSLIIMIYFHKLLNSMNNCWWKEINVIDLKKIASQLSKPWALWLQSRDPTIHDICSTTTDSDI